MESSPSKESIETLPKLPAYTEFKFAALPTVN